MRIIKHTNSLYLLDKQYIGYSKYRVDGKKINNLEELLPLQFDHIPVIESIRQSSPVVYYINKDNKKMSIHDYEANIKNLYKCDENENWDSLDEEFEYKKFVKEWTGVREDKVEYNPVILDILYGNVKSEYDDIVPIYTLEENTKSELFIWTPNFQKYVDEIAKKYEFVNIGFDKNYSFTKGRKYSFGRTDSIEYMKMCGSYASGLYERSIFRIKSRRDTYDKLVDARANAIEAIDSYFKTQYQKTNESKLNNVGHVIAQLELIKASVSKIDQKVRTRVSKYSVLKQIDLLINELSK